MGCFCIGTNQVALKDAMLRGVPVFNAPFSNTRSVAELVLAEAVLLLRGIPEKHGLLKQGVWQKSASASFEIRGKTLGVIGYGNIGSQLGVMAEALGMHVQFYDVVKRLNLGNARQLDSFDELLSTSDVVTLHVPELPTTRNMIGARETRADEKDGRVDQCVARQRRRSRRAGGSAQAPTTARRRDRRLSGRTEVERRSVRVAAARRATT